MKNIFIIILVVLFCFFILRCEDHNGMFGNSKTKEEAKLDGSTVFQYVPSKMKFNLLDGTKMTIDTAWTEISFTYQNGKKIFDSSFGYNFVIPFRQEESKKFSFSFTFNLIDTSNRFFTNGLEENKCVLRPRTLYHIIAVTLEQKNPDTSKGWAMPIVSDTIMFSKLK